MRAAGPVRRADQGNGSVGRPTPLPDPTHLSPAGKSIPYVARHPGAHQGGPGPPDRRAGRRVVADLLPHGLLRPSVLPGWLRPLAGRTKATYVGGQYRRLVCSQGKKRAAVHGAHTFAVDVGHLLARKTRARIGGRPIMTAGRHPDPAPHGPPGRASRVSREHRAAGSRGQHAPSCIRRAIDRPLKTLSGGLTWALRAFCVPVAGHRGHHPPFGAWLVRSRSAAAAQQHPVVCRSSNTRKVDSMSRAG